MLKTTEDIDRILKVLLHDSIYSLMCEDNGPDKSDFELKIRDELFFMDDMDRCCFIAYPFTSQICWVHAHIIDKYRDQKYNLANQFFEGMKNYTISRKIMSSIPVIYKNIIVFSEKLGFTYHSCHRECYLKNGELHDCVIMIKDLY